MPNNGNPQAYMPKFEEWVIQHDNFTRMLVEPGNGSQMDARHVEAVQGSYNPEESPLRKSPPS